MLIGSFSCADRPTCGMESRPKDRVSEVEEMSVSQDGVHKESASAEVHNGNATPDASKPQERKSHHVSSRSATPGSSSQRSSHSLDKYIQSSPAIGALDLQPAAIGRSGSSLSGVTVPVRLDALSYLLNTALMGTYKMPPQVPFYGPQCMPSTCQMCPYTQMGCSPYGSCMNHGPAPCSAQPGYLACANQQGIQTYLPQNPNYMQCVSNAPAGPSNSAFQSSSPQSGAVWNASGTGCAQPGAPNFQPGVSSWARRPNDGYANVTNNIGSSEREQSRASPQGGSGRFGDKQKDDSWSGRQQRDFNRPPGRGRGSSSGRPWQHNFKSQDRSRNTDFFPEKRGFRSPESSPGRGQYSKRGRWAGGRDQEGDHGDTWQQKSQHGGASGWFGATSAPSRFEAGNHIKPQSQTDEKKDVGGEDWETEYPDDKTGNSEAADPAGQPAGASLPASLPSGSEMSDVKEPTPKSSPRENIARRKPTSAGKDEKEEEEEEQPRKSQDDAFEKFMRGYISDLVPSKDESAAPPDEQVDVAIPAVTIPREEKDCASSSCLPSAAILPEEEPVKPPQPVESNEGAGEGGLYTLVFSVDVEENKEIVLELLDDTSA